MDAQTYLRLADQALDRVARALDVNEDLEVTRADGLVAIVFEDGTKYVLNRQSGAHQMWFAAAARAWHYDWEPTRETWVDDRDGHELWVRVGEVVSQKLGTPVSV